ncbi:phosphate ABC transporter permease subunit PstC [Natrarchaeobius sp. A-rgal3]|uniref:phosphate ABC transporter permease subunit PstC n=1 Tax=Natrarchaeobius versutus TaxID=1679078 RepID=UPI00350FC127
MSTDTDSKITFTDERVDGDQRRNSLVRGVLFVCTSITVVTTLAIFWVLFNEATHFFFDRRFTGILLGLVEGAEIGQRVTFTEFFAGTHWDPTHAINPGHWILPLVWGTLLITVGAAFVSIPIGTLTALYLSEYASSNVRKYLKPGLEILAGVPTIVYGFFAISFLTPWLIQPIAELFGQQTRATNAAAGALVVGIMTIPIVASISEDAMNSVPDELRNGAYALGATKYQVSTRIVLPASVSGVFAAYILAISRAIGETMAVVLAAGFTAQITLNPFVEIQTMTAYMVDAARGEAVIGSIRYQSLFAVGLALFVMTLAMNLLNDRLKQRYREEYQ